MKTHLRSRWDIAVDLPSVVGVARPAKPEGAASFVQSGSRPLALKVGTAFGPARKAISALAASAFFAVALAAAVKRIS